MKHFLHCTPILVCSLPLVAQANASAQDPSIAAPGADFSLGELSLEQLMEVPVEVGSRQAQSLAETAASVFVLTENDIRRSGMRTVPELLRLVPGLIIAQDVPGAYGFSSRLGEYGFAGMLVLIDGQRLYTTLLRREYWQAVDLPIEVIERIEVVRGPGGSRWGDKASQGVINIVTKKAAQAKGLRLTGWAGTEEKLGGSFRFGESLGENTDFYLHGKMVQRDGGAPTTSGDRWDNNSIGGRVDTVLADGVTWSVDGLYHDSFIGDSFEIAPGFSSLNMIKGGHVKSKLRIDHSPDQWTEWRMGADAYDQDIRDYLNNVPDDTLIFREELFDTLLMHSLAVTEGHRLTVGAVLRQLTVESFRVATSFGREYNETRGDLFVSWDWDLSETVRLTLGGNIGYQDGLLGSGVDTQPDLRLAWRPDADLTIWTALSTNREPDRKIPDSGILVRRKSSNLLAYELGVRKRFGEQFMMSVDTFVYAVEDQLSDFGTDPGTGATTYITGARTDAFGGEAYFAWKPTGNTRVTGFVATTEANTQNDPNGFVTIEDEVPRLRGGATVGFDPLPGLELDSNLLYTQRRAGIPKWWRLDLRLAWHATANTTLEVVGQNLTDPRHQEYFFLEEVQRGFYVMVTHRF